MQQLKPVASADLAVCQIMRAYAHSQPPRLGIVGHPACSDFTCGNPSEATDDRWTPEEDAMLAATHAYFGHDDWRSIAIHMPGRCDPRHQPVRLDGCVSRSDRPI